MAGKITPADLERFVFSRTGAENDDVLVGPGAGEDAAAIRTAEGTLVVSADPVSLAADRVGDIGVAVASNDVAACGGVPEYLLATLLLPRLDADLLDTITGQIDARADHLGLAVVGGHTESVAGLERPLVSLTCMGYADRYVPTAGATPGDHLVLTKGAGIEATAVLASDFADDARAAGVDDDAIETALGFFDELSVMPESAVLSPVATAMHDPTEGGVLGGLVETALASEVTLAVDVDAIPVRPETTALCAAVDVDPLRVLGSGALLAAVPESEVAETLTALDREGIVAADVGTVEAGAPGVELDGTRHTEHVPDEMYDLW